jgi:heterodisulfide reductase subunit A-like polyferredoxin
MEMKGKPTGAVLVVGGGIGGIQAALDLAESGYYVYLVERSPSIGGVMAQLDKTFPTNDCSMCILAPKLVECGRDLNIEVITCAEVLEVQGEPGNFKALIKKHPRYVDLDKCTGCGECTDVCPVERLSEFDEGLGQRKAIYRPFPQAYPNAFAIEKGEKPPCRLTCPAGINVQGYVALISKGKYRESLNLIRESVPFPGVLGRICPAPCEGRCNRGLIDEPIAIRALKRFAADYGKELVPHLPEVEPKDEKVAIVGSGPAGLTAAYFLAKEGYKVTVFEALPVPGGMLYVGIPGYRLPKKVLLEEIEWIKRFGVEIKTNTPIGQHLKIDDLFQQGYKAVFLAVGAHRSRKLNIRGEDAEGVIHGVDFLRKVNLDEEVRIGKKVAVVGGGDVAIDAARVAARMGCDVTILYRRSRAEMPARDEEVIQAESEGIKIEFLVAPVEVLTQDGRVKGVRCVRMRLGEPDASGRRRPIPIEGSEFDLDVDTLIPAIGQAPDTSFLKESGIKLTDRGTIEADPLTLQTSREGVFAGGDCQTGPGIAIEAIAAGKRAAESIIRYLKGQDLKEGRELKEKGLTGDLAPLNPLSWWEERKPRREMPALPLEERVSSFEEIEKGFNEDEAIEEANRCLNCGICSECLQCVSVCKAKAIDHEMEEEIVELEVGALILSPGFKEFDPSPIHHLGYRRYPNVVTSIEFERMLSASGPYQGDLLRPSDKKPPRRIAWIQCVGSRDASCDREYCSSVCCTYAIKQAIVAKEHVPHELDETIFFMDMRTQGKGFERFYERGKEEGIKFLRAKVYQVEEADETGSLLVRYLDEDGRVVSAEFDLVVLSVGFQPSEEVVRMARDLGIQLNPYGFCHTSPFAPVETSKPGVFVCGAFSGPRDIPETVMQASGAAGSAAVMLSPARNTLTKKKEYPPERDVSGQEPRIGVFICHCGINIGGVVNVPEVVEYAKTLPNVVYVEDNLYTCSQDTQERIKEKIAEYDLNRVVVASCSPRTHEPLFQETIREAGLNKYLFEMANIRDQCSWVHMYEPEEATEKAKDLVRMTVAKVALKRSLKPLSLPINRSALVIGGGVAGMMAALTIADQGFEVHLLERGEELGGMARRIHYNLDGEDVQSFLSDLIRRVEEHPRIRVYTHAYIVDAYGYVGNFTTEIMRYRGRTIESIEHGVTIIAAGAEEHKPNDYLYGKDPRVLTQLELEEEIARGSQDIVNCDNLVMIQCVGSREEERPYCSRVCCNQAIKNALKLKEINPEMNIYILYRDIRTYGFYERYYREAREKGIIFLRYSEGERPHVTRLKKDGQYLLRVEVKDPVLGEEIAIDADILALSVPIVPSEDARELATFYKVPLNEDNFFLEAHVKLRPVDFATDGVFLCGLAHAPKSISESIAQAKAAALRATNILVKEALTAEGIVCEVREEICGGCGICEALCPYGAIAVDKERRVASVNEALCKGCGTCAAACPSGAAQLRGFRRDQISAMLAAALSEV